MAVSLCPSRHASVALVPELSLLYDPRDRAHITGCQFRVFSVALTTSNAAIDQASFATLEVCWPMGGEIASARYFGTHRAVRPFARQCL